MVAVVRTVCFTISARVIMRTPVDTGLARSGWMPSIGAPDLTHPDPRGENEAEGSAQESRDRLRPVLDGYDPAAQNSFFFTNSVKYIVPLEYGHSKQAPQGMLRLTVAEFATVTTEAVNTVNNGGAAL